MVPTIARPEQRLRDVGRAAARRDAQSAARQHRPARLQRRALPRAAIDSILGQDFRGPRARRLRQRLHRPHRGDLRRSRPAGRSRALPPQPAQPRGGAELRPLLPPRARRVLQVGGARRPPRAGLPVPHGRGARRGAGGGAVHDRGRGDRPRRRGAPRLPQRVPRDRLAEPGAAPRRADPHPPRVRGLLRPVPARRRSSAPACTGPTADRTACCWRRWRCAAPGPACRSRCSCTASTRSATRAPCCCRATGRGPRCGSTPPRPPPGRAGCSTSWCTGTTCGSCARTPGPAVPALACYAELLRWWFTDGHLPDVLRDLRQGPPAAAAAAPRGEGQAARRLRRAARRLVRLKGVGAAVIQAEGRRSQAARKRARLTNFAGRGPPRRALCATRFPLIRTELPSGQARAMWTDRVWARPERCGASPASASRRRHPRRRRSAPSSATRSRAGAA